MSVRVRFAPSPTGHLHIGGARTALYNQIFAKAQGGQFILRIEDTDKERSTSEFEESQIKDMQWLGFDFDESPANPGEYGPYRQSERIDIYQEQAHKLLAEGKAFYDFCSDEELEIMKEENQKNGTAAYTGKWRNSDHWDEAKTKVANGESAPIRFLVPNKDYAFKDHVRGDVKFPAGMVGDFVILRTNGLPTYNFSNVIDDSMMKITHVIRGEDHVNNTLRQLMVYEAIEAKVPEFVHVSLLIGEDRQKLSKRHGATSVKMYREEGYLPEALDNYLCLLGWSHPEEKDIFNMNDLENVFNLDRFSKSHAIYDIEKLKWVNQQHLKDLPIEDVQKRVSHFISKDSFYFSQSGDWQKSFLQLFVEKVHLLTEFESFISNLITNTTFEKSDELDEINSWETTPQIRDYVKEQLSKTSDEFLTSDIISEWMNYCKKELKIKGKPLFMGVRGVLTGLNHGPDLKVLVSLIPVATLKARLEL